MVSHENQQASKAPLGSTRVRTTFMTSWLGTISVCQKRVSRGYWVKMLDSDFFRVLDFFISGALVKTVIYSDSCLTVTDEYKHAQLALHSDCSWVKWRWLTAVKKNTWNRSCHPIGTLYMDVEIKIKEIHQTHIWLVVDLPLWKIWIRQLGWWHTQLNGKIKVMFQSPPTIMIYHYN